MNQQLVGTITVDSAEALRSQLERLATGDCCYFARWAHRVSGLVPELASQDFPSPEGQMFGAEFELRWKQQGHGYELLLLHCHTPVTERGFEPVGSGWQVSDKPLETHQYDRDETRFPQGFNRSGNLQLQQHYFQDAETATVHFIALTLVLP